MTNFYYNYKIYNYQYYEICYLINNFGVTKTINANLIVKSLFNIINRLTDELSKAFKQKYQLRSIYYQNLSYYKRFGGVYPTTNTIDNISDYISWLKSVKEDLYTLITKIKSTKPWSYNIKAIKIIELFKDL